MRESGEVVLVIGGKGFSYGWGFSWVGFGYLVLAEGSRLYLVDWTALVTVNTVAATVGAGRVVCVRFWIDTTERKMQFPASQAFRGKETSLGRVSEMLAAVTSGEGGSFAVWFQCDMHAQKMRDGFKFFHLGVRCGDQEAVRRVSDLHTEIEYVAHYDTLGMEVGFYIYFVQVGWKVLYD